jgi:hypothetical protein
MRDGGLCTGRPKSFYSVFCLIFFPHGTWKGRRMLTHIIIIIIIIIIVIIIIISFMQGI